MSMANLSELLQHVMLSRSLNFTPEKKQTEKTIRIQLALSFKDLYNHFRYSNNIFGPVSVYSPQNLILFISACGFHRTAKIMDIGRLLQQHGKGLDFCYYMLSLCDLFPTYAWKLRAAGIIKQFLNANRLPCNSRYTLKVYADYEKDDIRQ